MKLPVLVIISSALLMSGCGQKSNSTENKGDKSAAPAPAKTAKLGIVDVKQGTGDAAAAGDMVWVQYVGTFKNGKIFDQSSDRMPVLGFTIGQGAVIKGWEQGVFGMKVGGERKLAVPSELAYGENGDGNKIPANTDLDFDIKMVALVKAGEEKVISTHDIKVGAGPRVVKAGDTVSIQYEASFPTGKVFDSSKGKAYTFTIGGGKTLPCIERGVQGMKVGGVREIIAPPATAFDTKPTTIVPPNSLVKFKIELVSIQ